MYKNNFIINFVNIFHKFLSFIGWYYGRFFEKEILIINFFLPGKSFRILEQQIIISSYCKLYSVINHICKSGNR